MKPDWLATNGTVADVVERRDEGSTRYSVVFTYKVDGSWYGGTYTSENAVTKGDSITVRYDPANPEKNDLVERENAQRWIVGIMAAVVVLWFILERFF